MVDHDPKERRSCPNKGLHITHTKEFIPIIRSNKVRPNISSLFEIPFNMKIDSLLMLHLGQRYERVTCLIFLKVLVVSLPWTTFQRKAFIL